MIRAVRITEDKRKQVAAHFIGWAIKWDEWVDFQPRIAKRNTNTIGPHRPRRRDRGGYSGGYSFGSNSTSTATTSTATSATSASATTNPYQTQLTQLSAMGFTDTNLNTQALMLANGDVEQTISILIDG